MNEFYPWVFLFFLYYKAFTHKVTDSVYCAFCDDMQDKLLFLLKFPKNNIG